MPNKTDTSRNAPVEVDEYLSRLPEAQKKCLQDLRESIKKLVPEVTERIGYQMPVMRINSVDVRKNHLISLL